MLSVSVEKSDVEHDLLTDIYAEIAAHYRSITLRPQPSLSEDTVLNLLITTRRMPKPYAATEEQGVAVSLWQSEGICQYARIAPASYAALCCLLAITQWRVLLANPLIQPEDLIHPDTTNCLFNLPKHFHDFALLLEDPRICRGCKDFYHCLGAETEVIAVRDALTAIHASPARTL